MMWLGSCSQGSLPSGSGSGDRKGLGLSVSAPQRFAQCEHSAENGFLEEVASKQLPGDKQDTRKRMGLFPAEEVCAKEVGGLRLENRSAPGLTSSALDAA